MTTTADTDMNTPAGWPTQQAPATSPTAKPMPALNIGPIGPLQIAALMIGGGGLAVLLSAALPWVSAMGVASAGPSGGEILALLVLGGSLTALASFVFRNRSMSTVRVLLWVLAVVDIIVVIAFFGLLKLDSGVVGDVVSPGIGFYLALLGLLASIAGTVTQQVVKARATDSARSASSAQSAPSVGTTYASVPASPVTTVAARPVAPAMVPAEQPQSPDGHYWWDGTAWVAYA